MCRDRADNKKMGINGELNRKTASLTDYGSKKINMKK